jgi:hypothetical protein
MFENIIKIPYTTKPDLKRYDGPIIIENPLESYLEAKEVEREILNCTYESDLAIEKQLVKKTVNALGLNSEYNTIISFGSSIQEDVAIFHEGKLEAYFIAFPSGWNPSDKAGKTLKELHEPVADGEELRNMSNKIAEILSAKYSYHRYVWNVVPTGMLSMHPDYGFHDEEAGVEYETVNDLWFRLEHQTTFPVVKNETFAFFINVDVLPYVSLHEDDKKLIVESINSMTDAVLDYKHLRKVKAILNK